MTARDDSFQLIVVMGVAGCGKSTIGRTLAAGLGWPYHEADDFHPPRNVHKMSRGEPLTDEDRAPWLASIRAKMEECAAAHRSAVFSCSALKAAYRDTLAAGLKQVTFVYLKLDEAQVLARVSGRQGHFMKSDMVRSQFAALEPPTDAWTVDARRPADEIVACIRERLDRTV